MSQMKTQHPTDEEQIKFSIRSFKGIDVGLGQKDPGASIAQKLEEQYPDHLILIQAGTFLHGYNKTAHTLNTLKQYRLKLVGTSDEPHIRVGFPAGMIELTPAAFRGYIPAQVLENTLASGMSPRKSVAFFTSIGFAPMGGMGRQYKTRKGNRARRLATVFNILPTPLENGFQSQQGARP